MRLRPRAGARLHLGCGDTHLTHYLNVDLPLEGPGPRTRAPDLEADVTALSCPPGTLAEVRLHHVFEHFDRAQALALLVRWYEWLVPAGTLTIETPDFEGCIAAYATATPEQRSLILRHVFGSQEAEWAQHRDGWSEHRFRQVLARLGYEVMDCRGGASDEQGLMRNVTVRARRPELPMPWPERVAAAHSLLEESTNGAAPSERELLAGWRRDLDAALGGQP